MTTFNWQISSMSAYPKDQNETDVVFQVDWGCVALDSDGYSARAFGSVPVTYTAGSPFTPYDQLTQDQVWGWINPSIDRPATEADLQASIDAQKNPAVVTPPLPWSN